MGAFYKASGEVSPLFYLFLVLSMLTTVPIFSFIQATIFWYSPYLVMSVIVLCLCVYFMAYICERWCIRKGKVRNKTVAIIAGLLICAFYFFLSIVFYCAYAENILTIDDMAMFFTNPSALVESVGRVLATGFSYTMIGGSITHYLRGPSLLIAFAFVYVLWQVLIVLSYITQSKKPFLEEREQWAEEIKLEFGYVFDIEELIKNIRCCDSDYINDLTVHHGVNISYSVFELYPMGGYYCLSVHNQVVSQPDKNGHVVFRKRTLFEHLFISEQAGKLLLAKPTKNDWDYIKATVLNKHTRRRELVFSFQKVFVGILFGFFSVYAYLHRESAPTGSTPAVFVTGAAAVAIYFTLMAVDSFLHEDVIVLEEDNDANTEICRLEHRDHGIAYKIFSLFGSLASVGFLVYLIFVS